MLNGIFVFIVLTSILLAAIGGQMEPLTRALVETAGKAVELAIGLVGVMALFLGLMQVAQDAGLLRGIARAVSPLMRRLFPDIPEDHPAMSAMILNISATFLGLSNAATPFGIKAMEELDRLNGEKGTATDSMALFLAINTAGLTLIPTTVIAVRASLGSDDPTGIFLPTWLACGTATVVGITAAKLLGRLPRYRSSAPAVAPDGAAGPSSPDRTDGEPPEPLPVPARRWLGRLYVLAVLGAAITHIVRNPAGHSSFELFRELVSFWVLPAIFGGILLHGWVRGVRVYDSVITGAREGFQVALRIIPYLVAILVAVGMLRASGGIELLVRGLGPVTALIGMPAEVVPMALLRPLSGSGALGVMSEIMTTHGPDSLIGYMVSTLQGSTETTFYVLAVYFGAVGVRRTRQTVPACLAADTAGILAAVFVVNLLYS